MSQSDGQDLNTSEKATDQDALVKATGAPEAPGVSFNNIPPSTSKLIGSRICSGGEDTAKISLWVNFSLKQFQELGDKLDALKSSAQADGTDSYLPIGFDQWLVKNSGFYLGGSGKRGPYFRWQIMHGGIKIGIANRYSALQRIGAPNVWVEIGSEVLMVSGGLKPVYASVVETITGLGGKIAGHVLSEVHACVDMPDVDVAEFCRRFHARQYVTRARNNNTHAAGTEPEMYVREHGSGLRPTGFEIGGAVRLCVYEKRWEVRNSPTKKAVLENCRWGKEVYQAVRVEFKMRRETLKIYGIHTVEDWEREKGGMVHWLTHDWFRMTETKVNRTNTTRTVTWKMWERVQDLFADWAGSGVLPPKLGMGIHVGAASLVRQAAGCLLQAMALMGVTIKDKADFAQAAGLLLKAYTSFEEVKKKLAQKCATFAAKTPKWAFFQRDSIDHYSEQNNS